MIIISNIINKKQWFYFQRWSKSSCNFLYSTCVEEKVRLFVLLFKMIGYVCKVRQGSKPWGTKINIGLQWGNFKSKKKKKIFLKNQWWQFNILFVFICCKSCETFIKYLSCLKICLNLYCDMYIPVYTTLWSNRIN